MYDNVGVLKRGRAGRPPEGQPLYSDHQPAEEWLRSSWICDLGLLVAPTAIDGWNLINWHMERPALDLALVDHSRWLQRTA